MMCLYSGLFVCFDNICVQREETDAFRDLGSGNRIATWLTYVSTCQNLLVAVRVNYGS